MFRARSLLGCLLPAAALLLACSAKDLSEFNAGGAAGSASGGAAGSGGSSGTSGAAGSGSGGSAGTATGGSSGTASGGSAGTGGGTGGAGTGGTGGSPCEGLCNQVAQLACPNENQAACRPDCEAQYAACKPEYDALLACVQSSGNLGCDDSGELFVGGCDASLSKALVCAACIPSVSADSCEVCQAKNCCSQTKSYLAEPNAKALETCTDGCVGGDDTCIQACIDQFPGAGAKAIDLFQCMSTSCGVECN